MSAIKDFPVLTREGKASNRLPYASFHAEPDLNALAGDDLNFTFHMAAAEGKFPGAPGKYTIRLNTLTERDGECVYNVYVNDQPAGLFQKNPPTNEFTAPATLTWTGIDIPADAAIRVESNNWSNLLRPEANFFEYARGRWTSLDFIPEQESKTTVNKETIGIFEAVQSHSGPVSLPHTHTHTLYFPSEDAYYLSGTSEFLWKTVTSDFELESLITLIPQTDSISFFAGLKVSSSLDPDAPYIACIVRSNGQVSLKYRKDPGAATSEILFTITNTEIVQLRKKGNTFTMSVAKFGQEYERQSVELPGLAGDMKAGFFAEGNGGAGRFGRVRFFSDLYPETAD
ncbi:MAG TPA: hypothetical protein VI583_06785 [Cyclobacteriaceae bacterium]|nr:hypothetical protein [Cyclobacteriaceae bacterium]